MLHKKIYAIYKLKRPGFNIPRLQA
uniref:Uncharacterized protein n=1 Tax=Arundo donax TaxID=35708 RepID=A0A0A9H5L0_ARUDO